MNDSKRMEITEHMKLYTEEQVIKLTQGAFTAGQNHNTFIFGEVYKNITPIPLPSDEEIYEQAKSQSTFAPSFIYGAEWMRDKIIGGKK
jgi:hypothetical protein